MVTTEFKEYKHYGRCLSIKNEALEALVTADVGPRIISFAPTGGPNLFFNDDEDKIVTKGEVFESIFGEGAEFHFYGGHRLWLAPQLPLHTNVPDNGPLDVEVLPDGGIFTGQYSPVSGMRPRMTVRMDETEGKITVTAEYLNASDETRSYAPWQITQFAPGGVGFVPFGKRNDAEPFEFSTARPQFRGPRPALSPEALLKPLTPGKVFILFDIGHLKDPRLHLHNRHFVLQQDPEIWRPFKAGMLNPEGFGLYALDGWVVTAQHEVVPGGNYTDGGSSFEVYTGNAFMEIEALGEFKEVAPGESLVHTETLSVQKAKRPLPDLDDERDVHDFVWTHHE